MLYTLYNETNNVFVTNEATSEAHVTPTSSLEGIDTEIISEQTNLLSWDEVQDSKTHRNSCHSPSRKKEKQNRK